MNPTGKRRRPKCFTLIELIVVLVILGILAALAIPTFNAIRQRGAQTVAEADATTIARAATNLYAMYQGQAADIPVGEDNLYTCVGSPGCDTGDVIAAAAYESGYKSTPTATTPAIPAYNGQAEITAVAGGWMVEAQKDTDNNSCAKIAFADQAFSVEAMTCPA